MDTIKSIFYFYLTSFRAGSGKTTLVKSVVEKLTSESKQRRPLYLINVDQEELQFFKKLKTKSVKQIGFTGLEKTKVNSIVLAEDIISVTEAEQIHLRRALNYSAHHKTQKIVCVAHMIFKTSMYSMLSFFHYIFFSSSKANLPLIRMTFNYFKLNSNEEWIRQFLLLGEGGKHGIYFFFDCHKMTFNILKDINNKDCSFSVINEAGGNNSLISSSSSLPSDGNLQQQQEDVVKAIAKEDMVQKMQSKFELLTSTHPKAGQASIIFSMIVNCLNVEKIRAHDLTLSFKKLDRKSPVIISLVNYVLTLLDENSKGPPVKDELIVLHKYLQNFCVIPEYLTLNSTLNKFKLKQ